MIILSKIKSEPLKSFDLTITKKRRENESKEKGETPDATKLCHIWKGKTYADTNHTEDSNALAKAGNCFSTN